MIMTAPSMMISRKNFRLCYLCAEIVCLPTSNLSLVESFEANEKHLKDVLMRENVRRTELITCSYLYDLFAPSIPSIFCPFIHFMPFHTIFLLLFHASLFFRIDLKFLMIFMVKLKLFLPTYPFFKNKLDTKPTIS